MSIAYDKIKHRCLEDGSQQAEIVAKRYDNQESSKEADARTELQFKWVN